MNRIEREKETIRQMIELYCRRKEKNRTLCPRCRELLDYAFKRLDRCRYGERKGVCRHCPTHCYAPDFRDRVRRVMRFAGPRMLFVHPMAAIRHLLSGKPRLD